MTIEAERAIKVLMTRYRLSREEVLEFIGIVIASAELSKEIFRGVS